MAVLLMLAGVVFFFISPVSIRPSGSTPAPLAIGTPVQTVEFDDGSSLQILKIGEGEIVDGEMNPKPPISMFSSHSTGIRGTGMGGRGVSCTISSATMDDQITGLRFESPPANLLIQMRLLDSLKRPVESQRVLWQGEIRMKHQKDEDFPGWHAMLEAPAEDARMPEVVIQLADGTGGWIDGCGPTSMEDDREHRGMIAFTAWPRTATELEFRAARPGMEPVTWKMKNPLPASKPEPWTVSPLPQKQVESDFELELNDVVKLKGKRMIQPKFVFRSKVPGDTQQSGRGTNGSTMLDCTCQQLLGAWGSRTEEGYYKLPGNESVLGFPYPPDEEVLRFRFVIRPTEAYPYPRSGALMIATAKVAADGKAMESRPTILTGHGILSVEYHQVTTGDEGGFQYTIKGRWNSRAEMSAGKAALGERVPVCFVGELDVSTGTAHTSGRSSSGSGDVTRFEREGRWDGPLHPGDEITLGMTDPLPVREVFFTFETPHDY